MTEQRRDLTTLRVALETITHALDVPAEGRLGRISVAPVVHGRLEPAWGVRARFRDASPSIDCVAVEVPETLRAELVRGIAQLPSPTAIRWRDEPDGRRAFVVVHACDAVCEAGRWAIEHGIALECVDADVDDHAAPSTPPPDPAVITRIGIDAYAGAWLRWPPPPATDRADDRARAVALREATMAYHLHALRERFRNVLFVCGLDRVRGVIERMSSNVPPAPPLRRVRRDGVKLFALSARTLENDVLPEPPYLQAAYERARDATRVASPRSTSGDAAELDVVAIDRFAELGSLFLRARDRQREGDGDAPGVGALRVASAFARNLALVDGRLAPDLYDTLVAARGISDDFAYHVWSLATDCLWRVPRESALPEADVTLDETGRGHRIIRFERRVKTRRHVLRLVRPRTRESRPGEWKERWQGAQLCSYPPEDVRIEAFGATMRKQASSMISGERMRVGPFVASLLDGIDLRETIRNIAHDGRLFVREEQPIRGKVGAVVLVFDEDLADGGRAERFPYAMTWQGEHEQESDMALYATEPATRMVGPGIARCEYGGLLMTYPPGRMFAVWEDPYFAQARSKPERLLMAAIDYCLDRLIVYIGPRPPPQRASTKARRAFKRVLFVPIGTMSAETLQRLRTFHVLDGHHVRSYAREHIG